MLFYTVLVRLTAYKSKNKILRKGRQKHKGRVIRENNKLCLLKPYEKLKFKPNGKNLFTGEKLSVKSSISFNLLYISISIFFVLKKYNLNTKWSIKYPMVYEID